MTDLKSAPPYSHSGPAPGYRHEPDLEEVSLLHTPRLHRVQRSSEPTTFNKTWPQALSLTLHQYLTDDTSESPVYSRNASVTGEVELFNRGSVIEVTATLDGTLGVNVTNGGGCHVKVAHEKHTLWKQNPSDGSSSCPAILPLCLKFPETYSLKGDEEHRLPPTYDFASYGLVVLLANCSYHLTIRITHSPKTRLQFWNFSESYSLPLCYRPRTRPTRPLVPDGTPLSYIKICPEEYHQISMTISPKNRLSTQKPLYCQFLLPSVQTFYIKDSIPAHIQIHGPSRSIQEFFTPDSIQEQDANGTPKKRRKVQLGSSKPVVRIFLARQIFVDVSGRKSWRTVTIGECENLTAGTPHYHATPSSSEGSLDWHGFVRCGSDISTVGFVSGPLSVKDFLVFSLTPAYPATSKFPSLHHAHAIRLVTDSWHDDRLIHPNDV